jgi:hypothetical protein
MSEMSRNIAEASPLLTIAGIKSSFVNDEEFHEYINYKKVTCNNSTYYMVNYKKEKINSENRNKFMHMRSLIYDQDEKLVCYTPAKSVLHSNPSFQNLNSGNLEIQMFVEGTQMNVFYNTSDSKWEIATRSVIGGKNHYFKINGKATKSFGEMFYECCEKCSFAIDTLDKKYCYTFVFQHPENRVVNLFTHFRLYLIDAFEIRSDSSIHYVSSPFENIAQLKEHMTYNKDNNTHISPCPRVFFEEQNITMDMLDDVFGSLDSSVRYMGVVVKNTETGERMKIRNPNYEYARELRGNQPKMQYRYLELHKNGNLRDYLLYYPEHASEIKCYEDTLFNFTSELYGNYSRCYIKKEKPILDFPYKYRAHMFRLHEYFKAHLRPYGGYVDKKVAIDYVNSLHESELMYALNYEHRKRTPSEEELNVLEEGEVGATSEIEEKEQVAVTHSNNHYLNAVLC